MSETDTVFVGSIRENYDRHLRPIDLRKLWSCWRSIGSSVSGCSQQLAPGSMTGREQQPLRCFRPRSNCADEPVCPEQCGLFLILMSSPARSLPPQNRGFCRSG
jgi:hypothetical protein